MQKESGFAPLLIVIPVVLFILTGAAVGAYYYAQSGELPITFGNQQTAEVESSPLPSPASSSPLATPIALATPSPTPVPTPTPSPEIQITVEEDPLKPNCGIMFQTSFEIPIEQGDDSLAISKKAITQYLSQVKVSAAKENFSFLSSEERVFAEESLQKKIFLKDLQAGQKVAVPCEDIEKSCIAAQTAL